MEYIDVRQAAKNWDLTERRVTALCRNGRIPGAYKNGKLWMIPAKSTKPTDGRTREAYDINGISNMLPLPIGISDFKEAVTNYYYVDKTLMIRDFLNTIPKVSLYLHWRISFLHPQPSPFSRQL